MTHAALQPNGTAVITGAASGIGLAAARRLAGLGLNVVLADLASAALDQAREQVADVQQAARRSSPCRRTSPKPGR